MNDPTLTDRTQAEAGDSRTRDHLANERTLLAWQRTALTVMGLGVVVDRVNLGSDPLPDAAPLVGLLLIVLGAVLSLVGAYRFVTTERDIDAHRFRSSVLAHLALTAVVVGGGVVLALFLLLR